MTRLEGYQSRPEEMYAATSNMTYMAFINTGLLVQIVYFNWSGSLQLPFLLAEYDEFTSEWYSQVGSTVVVTMILMIFTPHVSNIGFQVLGSCRRCCDRKCSCSERKTRKYLQKDYEQINLGSEFDIEARYSNMLVVIGVTFLYSGAMPVLYISSGLFFFVTYWVDKYLLLRCYRKPIKFNDYMATKTLTFNKYFIILHVIGFTLMFGLTPILPLRIDLDSIDGVTRAQLQFQSNLGDFTLYSLYLWALLISVVILLITILPYRVIQNCLKICCKKKAIEFENEVNFCDDFYQCINYNTIKEELIQLQDNLDKARQLRRSGKYNMNECNRYVNLLQDQRSAIVSRIG